MTEEMTSILANDILKFECSSKNSCFNECCRDLNQFLTPYDILRLKNNLKLSSQEFLKKHTSFHYGPESGLPVITFKPNPDADYKCPFITEDGCSVYKDRPSSCRIYPLARAVTRSRETGKINEYFALIEEPHCKGFGRQTKQTVKEWLAEQEVEEYNEANDKLMQIISLKNQIMPGKLEGYQADKFYMACYDLDEFRKEIFDNNLLKDFNIPSDLLEKMKTDDSTLLDFGLSWIKSELFGKELEF